MKRARNDPLSIFSDADRPTIEKYVHRDFQISKKAPHAACAVSPLKLLMPLMIVRTVGVLKRSLPAPFADKRIPNFQPFLDRLTLVTYPKVKALQRRWVGDGANVRAYMLCVALLITQIDLFHVIRLLTTHYAPLEATWISRRSSASSTRGRARPSCAADSSATNTLRVGMRTVGVVGGCGDSWAAVGSEVKMVRRGPCA